MLSQDINWALLRRDMKQRIITLVVGMVALLGLLLVPQPERPPVFECTEDMQCWDWRTMGNGCAGAFDGKMVVCYNEVTGYTLRG